MQTLKVNLHLKSATRHGYVSHFCLDVEPEYWKRILLVILNENMSDRIPLDIAYDPIQ